MFVPKSKKYMIVAQWISYSNHIMGSRCIENVTTWTHGSLMLSIKCTSIVQ